MSSDSQPKGGEPHAGHRQRLRERYMRGGIGALADYEIVELFLTLCIPRADVKPAAKALLKKFGSMRGILDAPADELLKIEGLGESSVAAARLVKDLMKIYDSDELAAEGVEISTMSGLIKYFKRRTASEKSEVLELACFDAKLRLIPDGCARLVEGGVNSAAVDIRKIVETAIKKGASSIAIAHNHPSGDPRPSLEDIRLTRKISEACRPLNLNFIEHVIVGKNDCFSFRRDGRFDDLYDESLLESRLRGRAKAAEELEELEDDPSAR